MAVKRCKKINLYLYIITTIKKHGRLPRDKEKGHSRQKLSPYVQKLKSLNIIYSPSFSVWKIRQHNLRFVPKQSVKKTLCDNKNNKNFLHPNSQGKYKRVHGIQVRLQIPKFAHWLDILPTYLNKKNIHFDSTKKAKVRLEIEHDGFYYKTHFFKDSIILYFPPGMDFISQDVDLGKEMAKGHAAKIVGRLCRKIQRDLKVKGDYQITITRSHVGKMNSLIAKKLREKGHNLWLKIKGSLRVLTDNSYGILDELEFVDNDKNTSDVKRYENLIREVIEEGHSFNEQEDKIQSLLRNDTNLATVVEMQQQKILMQNKSIEVLTDNQERTNKILSEQDKTNRMIAKLLEDRGFSARDFIN